MHSQSVSCEIKFAHAHVRARTHVCDVRAKRLSKRACDVRACGRFFGCATCDRNFAYFWINFDFWFCQHKCTSIYIAVWACSTVVQRYDRTVVQPYDGTTIQPYDRTKVWQNFDYLNIQLNLLFRYLSHQLMYGIVCWFMFFSTFFSKSQPQNLAR